MTRLFVALVLSCAFAVPAWAQSEPSETQPEDRALIADCLHYGGAKEVVSDRACIGVVEAHCFEQFTDHLDNRALIGCAARERIVWENLRDGFAAELRAREHDHPEQLAALDAALAEAPRWAQARCDYEASFGGEGYGARITMSDCLRTQAAETALLLHWRLREWSNW